MDWIKGFTYIFEDRDWAKKMLVGSLVTSVPLAEAVSNGYQMQVIENLKAGKSEPLPEWQNAGAMFGRGLRLWLAVNAFYIPSIIISVVSWFIGLPFLLGMILNFFASQTMDGGIEQRGTVFVVGYLIQFAVALVAVLLGSVLLPVVFFFVPAMALRCQETGSLLSTLNIFAHVKFVLQNLSDYVISRILVAAMLFGMHLVASAIGGATFWIAGLGVLLAWIIGASARFWSRLAWAYFLAQMRLKNQPANAHFQINQNYQTPQINYRQVPENLLTPTANKHHYYNEIETGNRQ